MARLWLHDYDLMTETRRERPVSIDEDGTASRRYCVPHKLTAAGRRAFHGVIGEVAAQLADQLERNAQRAHQVDPEYTAADVHDARRAVERQVALRAVVDRSDHRVLAAIMLTIGTVGVGTMTNFLTGPWQVGLFLAFVTVAVAGLVLTWTGRSRTPSRGEP
jgi:hypothetical protein